MSCSEAGKIGGSAVKRKYGQEFYEAIGRKGGEATKQAHGHEFYETIGKKGGAKGGNSTRDKYGPDYYVGIGKKGGAKVKEMMAAGKKALADAATEKSKHDNNV